MEPMFVKIFSKIFDSTIAENWQARVVFMDLLILADRDGVIDMTVAAISRRTNCPCDFIKQGIGILCEPDHASRSEEDDGRRLELLDDHRDWGWRIINYKKYRDVKSSEELREKNVVRVRRFREKQKDCNGITSLPAISPASEDESASSSERASEGEAQIVAQWNAQVELPHVMRVTDGRRKAMRTRLGDKWWRENAAEGIVRIAGSAFCRGKNERGWKADFEWFLKPETLAKVMEGKYDDREGTNPTKRRDNANLNLDGRYD